MLFERLIYVNDGVARSGVENMAIDEFLLRELGEVPILRIYDWAGEWVSLGYFSDAGEARRLFGEEVNLVRRWTGGGIVDHRGDVTYTLVIPRGEELVSGRGNESYCLIHRELAKCLGEGGIGCAVVSRDGEGESGACFEKPVAWDLLGEDGRKLAGAGQRRTRKGILHQGSVRARRGALDGWAGALAKEVVVEDLLSGGGWEDLLEKYAWKGEG